MKTRLSLTRHQHRQLTTKVTAFLFAKVWGWEVEALAGRLSDLNYCRWHPSSITKMLDGDFGEVVLLVTTNDRLPGYREEEEGGNYPTVIWKHRVINGGLDDLAPFHLARVARDKAEFIVLKFRHPDFKCFFMEGSPDIEPDEEEILQERGVYVRRVGLRNCGAAKADVRRNLRQQVEARLDYLIRE